MEWTKRELDIIDQYASLINSNEILRAYLAMDKDPEVDDLERMKIFLGILIADKTIPVYLVVDEDSVWLSLEPKSGYACALDGVYYEDDESERVHKMTPDQVKDFFRGYAQDPGCYEDENMYKVFPRNEIEALIARAKIVKL